VLSQWGIISEVIAMPISSDVFPTVSCSCFKVSGLILKSLIQFKLILVQGEKHGSGLFSAWRYPVFPATFVEEAVVNYSLSEDS
jgi:hypothetical protein